MNDTAEVSIFNFMGCFSWFWLLCFVAIGPRRQNISGRTVRVSEHW
jgi:hypothetical protein